MSFRIPRHSFRSTRQVMTLVSATSGVSNIECNIGMLDGVVMLIAARRLIAGVGLSIRYIVRWMDKTVDTLAAHKVRIRGVQPSPGKEKTRC